MRREVRGLFLFVAVLLLAGLPSSGCRRAAFALLPPAPMGPPRTNDPFAPLGPTPGAGAAENGSTTVTTAGVPLDAGVSGAAVLSHFLGRGGFFFGVYGTFEEADLLREKPAASDRRQLRRRARRRSRKPAIGEAEKQKVMPIALPIHAGHMSMGTDALESMGHKLTFGDFGAVVDRFGVQWMFHCTENK